MSDTLKEMRNGDWYILKPDGQDRSYDYMLETHIISTKKDLENIYPDYQFGIDRNSNILLWGLSTLHWKLDEIRKVARKCYEVIFLKSRVDDMKHDAWERDTYN